MTKIFGKKRDFLENPIVFLKEQKMDYHPIAKSQFSIFYFFDGEGALKQLTEKNPNLTTRCSAGRFGCSPIAMRTHLHELGKMWKYAV